MGAPVSVTTAHKEIFLKRPIALQPSPVGDLSRGQQGKSERARVRIPNGPPSLVAGLLTFPFVGEARAALRFASLPVETIQRTVLDVLGACLRREVGEALTLLDSRPACKEGTCMDPARFPHAPHPLVPDSQTICGKTQ
jgi:hypothetical protein